MSSSKSQFPKPPRSAPSPSESNSQTTSESELTLLPENPMDQHLAPTLTMDSSTPSMSPDEARIPIPPKPPAPRPVSSPVSSSEAEGTPETVAASEELAPSPSIEATPAESEAIPAESEATPAESESSEQMSPQLRQQPIPPASEPMQYRAIGLVRGRYAPSEEQFTRGMLTTEDGLPIDAVLLGRVMSLVKKHLDLEQSHLWVVYPRTREKTNDLHLQIVGVWEPEKLNRTVDSDEESEVAEPVEEHTDNAVIQDDGYFSIRGEVLFYAPEEKRVIVKVQQAARKPDEQPKSFKLMLQGDLEGKSVGYFWDLNVMRQENHLVVTEGSMIAVVPPKKRTARKPGGRGGPRPPSNRKRWQGGPPREGGYRPQGPGGDRPNVAAPSNRREAPPKPVKRQRNQPNPSEG